MGGVIKVEAWCVWHRRSILKSKINLISDNGKQESGEKGVETFFKSTAWYKGLIYIYIYIYILTACQPVQGYFMPGS